MTMMDVAAVAVMALLVWGAWTEVRVMRREARDLRYANAFARCGRAS